ncbi:hypothetical protein ACOBMG_08060 [Limosilactobacillus mucosae]|uniref:hypothetical protein n=1 Tax=Limosilactobacillus mucosae TaxID=97478 RepID=UPI003B42F9BE
MKKVKNSLMAIFMIFGMTFFMAGCGNSSKSSQSSPKSETTSSKVVKKKSATKAKKVSSSSSKSKTSSSKADNESSSSSAVVTDESQSNSSSAQSSSNIQLGLNDVATWTDSNGVVHNVDSDGMDRQIKNGQTTYADWSGPLPSNAQVVSSSNSSSTSN